MAIAYETNMVTFSSVVYEDEVISLRDYLQENAGSEFKFDFIDCDDLHLSIIQLILAYKKSYSCSYAFGKSKKIYEVVLEGFDTSENYCN